MRPFSSYDPPDGYSRPNIREILVYLVLIGFIGYLLAEIVGSCLHMINHEEAQARFAELADVPVKSVEIVRHSCATPIICNPHDVKYELRIDGKPVSGRCVSDSFSEMTCRLYKSAETD